MLRKYFRKKTPIFGILLVVTVAIASMVVAGLSREGSVSADIVCQVTSEALRDIKSTHMTLSKVEYSEGRVVTKTDEEVWIKFPDKFHAVIISEAVGSNSENTKTSSMMKCNGKDFINLTLSEEGAVQFVQLEKNIPHWPGSDFFGYPHFALYTMPAEGLLLDKSNFRVMGEEKVGGKPAIKVELKGHSVNANGKADVSDYLFVDKKSGIVLREELHEGGQLSRRVEVKSAEMNIDIELSKFEFDAQKELNAAGGKLSVSDHGYTTVENVEELGAVLPYKYVLPPYLPSGYELCEVGYIDNAKLVSNNVPDTPNPVWEQPSFLVYRNGSNFIYVAQDALKEHQKGNPSSATGMPAFAQQEIELSNGKAYLYSMGESSGTLYFEAGKVKVRITGSVSAEELVKMAESMIGEGSK
jgi:outer membrane lipoprotein-sorting protein